MNTQMTVVDAPGGHHHRRGIHSLIIILWDSRGEHLPAATNIFHLFLGKYFNVKFSSEPLWVKLFCFGYSLLHSNLSMSVWIYSCIIIALSHVKHTSVCALCLCKNISLWLCRHYFYSFVVSQQFKYNNIIKLYTSHRRHKRWRWRTQPR